MILRLRWTASSTPDAAPSAPAGPVNSSTCTPAPKPCSPSNSPNNHNKINKPRSQAGIRRLGHGQHQGEADNKAGGSDNTSDNT